MIERETIQKEADAYFFRNKELIDKTECSVGMKIFYEFYDECKDTVKVQRMLEIGCCTGYNLIFMNRRYGITGRGIEASPKAVEYGNGIIRKQGLNVKLSQGFMDSLPYEDGEFDMVCLGFCMYQADRDVLFRTLAETDRVLKRGGYCVITDFDTPMPYLRENIHNDKISTYKTDYSRHLTPYGYTLVFKKTYTHHTGGFDPEVQERLSTQIFYKERIENLYQTFL